tara:strand:- start:4864 stop:7779 length:2916 start_codon:yes stop_codon:yes gene_type:complete
MSIVGEELAYPIYTQVKARQILHGSGKSYTRNNNQLKILNTQNSWIKLASGVSITQEKADEMGIPDLAGDKLAKKYVLFNGTSQAGKKGDPLAQKGKFLPGTYTRGEFGIVPMPGIENLTVKTLNRGSLKKATLKLKVHDRTQFEAIEVLYLRLGYTVLVEWGNNIYTSNGTNLKTINTTVTENAFFVDGEEGLGKNKTYLEGLGTIEKERLKYSGNYDGFFAKISNFEWAFQDDGSYDITITLISLGDVIESLKSNISISPQFIEFQSYTDQKDTTKEEIQSRSKSILHAFLWTWEYVNTDGTRIKYPESSKVKINGGDVVGYQMHMGDDTLSATRYIVKYKSVYQYNGTYTSYSDTQGSTKRNWMRAQGYAVNDSGIYEYTPEEYAKSPFEEGSVTQNTIAEQKGWIAYVGYHYKDWGDWREEADDDALSGYNPYTIDIKTVTDTTENPLLDTGIIGRDGFRTTHKGKPFMYIRFGALITYLQNKVIPNIKSGNETVPLFKIQNDAKPNGTIMYTIPNQQSNDLKKCYIRTKLEFPTDITEDDGTKHSKGSYYITANDKLEPFRTLDYNGDSKLNKYKSVNRAFPLNVYLHFDFVREVLDSNTDKDGNVSIFNLLKGLCDGINLSLGGINNLEPIMHETTNTLHIVDTTPIPGRVNPIGKYKLNLFGYAGETSNFIRKLDVKTAITPEYATMITVGATAGGNIKGVDATSFAKWNKGVIDKFKQELEPADQSSANSFPADPVKNYSQKTLKNFVQSWLCAETSKQFSSEGLWKEGVSDSLIDQNLSINTEFYKYAIARKNQLSSGPNVSGGIGFIPFKINFTIDGLSGIKIYNVLHVDTSFLPKVYGNTLDFIVTGITHKVSKGDWETELTVTVIPKSSKDGGVIENYDYLFTKEAEEALKLSLSNTASSATAAPSYASPNVNVNTGGGTGDGKGTLGTGATELAKGAYKDETELNNAIKKGLDIIKNL